MSPAPTCRTRAGGIRSLERDSAEGNETSLMCHITLSPSRSDRCGRGTMYWKSGELLRALELETLVEIQKG